MITSSWLHTNLILSTYCSLPAKGFYTARHVSNPVIPVVFHTKSQLSPRCFSFRSMTPHSGQEKEGSSGEKQLAVDPFCFRQFAESEASKSYTGTVL